MLPMMAERIEEIIYKNSPSKEDYLDKSKLISKLQQIIRNNLSEDQVAIKAQQKRLLELYHADNCSNENGTYYV